MRIFLTFALAFLCTGCVFSEDPKTPIPVEPNNGIGDGAEPLNQLLVISFDECLIAGGDIMESYPRQCTLNGEHFTEVLGPEQKGESLTRMFRIAPETTTCYGAHPQDCMVVNGALFYDAIKGFTFKEGYEYVLKVEQKKYCDPDVVNDCLQDVGMYKYSLIEEISKIKGSTAKEKCEEANGKWTPAGMLQKNRCVHSFSDAGKECSSSAECEGECIVTHPDGKNPVCALDDNPFGCKSSVEDFAKAGAILCVD